MNLRFIRGEEAVGDVDGDALLALGRQPVDQQGEVDLPALGADAAAVGLQRRQLVVEDGAGVVQQPADQGRLAVVDAAAGQHPQQGLAPVRLQPALHIRGDAGVAAFRQGHQK
jgi:type V secretory pathway adhesin AidA